MSWTTVFETDLFASFDKATCMAMNQVLEEVEDSAPTGLKDRAKVQIESCRVEAILAVYKTLEVVCKLLKSQQREISHCLVPHVKSQLADGYD
jgi:hypothetical protein